MQHSMNISDPNGNLARERKGLLVMLNPRNWSIQWKVRLNFFLRAVVAITLMVLTIYLFQRRQAFQEANDKLVILSRTQARYLEQHFTHLERQLWSFASDRQTAEAFNQLTSAFLNIESDDYLTTAATSNDKINILLESFYASDIVPVLESAGEEKVNMQLLLPLDNKQRILQYLYLAGNSKAMGAKSQVNKADDGSDYSALHAQYHPEMLRFARQSGVSDILFVDYQSGYVIYSLKKNLDFATNLFEGPYKNSGLGLAFKRALGEPEQGSVTYVDASLYLPALYQPQVFLSVPLYNGSQLQGVVVLALQVDPIDNLLALDNEDIAGGKTLGSFLIGPDFLYRTNDPDFLSDRESYLRNLKKHALHGETATAAARFGTTAMLQSVDPLPFADALRGKENVNRFTSETGAMMICAYTPVRIGNLEWILVARMNRTEALAGVHRFALIVMGIALMIAGILYYMSGVTSNAITSRLVRLRDSILKVTKGEELQVSGMDSPDEIGQAMEALDKLNRRLHHASAFVSELGKGNIDQEYAAESQDDRFGQALNNLRINLVQKREEEEIRRREDEIRNWTTHGIALFNDILRTDNNDLEKLSVNITRNVIEYLSANQGCLFLVEEEEGTRYLNLVAAYAYDRQKFLKKRIGIGEGLAGNCALEKKTVLLNRIPENYIEISSGLGGSKPRCLMIVPLKKEDEVLGVLEIASFNDFKPHEVEFAEKVAESIAASLITVQLHHQTAQYLSKFQQQAEEMKAQEEELRQSVEELQATHEQMERLKKEEDERNQQYIREIQENQKELEKEKALLDALLDSAPEHIYFKDKESRFIRFSTSMLKLFGLEKPEELAGKSDFDFFSEEHARPAYEDEQNIIRTGRAIIDLEEREVLEDGRESWVNTSKMPLRTKEGEIIGTFGISKNITGQKRTEMEVREMMKTIDKNRKLLIDILNKIPAKIFLKDEKGVFVVVNSSVAAIYNKTPEQIIGTSDYDNHPDEDVDSWRAQELEIVEKGEKTYLHLENVQGKSRYLNTTKMPFMLATTGKTGLLGIQIDVTDLKLLEEQVHQLKAEVERLKK